MLIPEWSMVGKSAKGLPVAVLLMIVLFGSLVAAAACLDEGQDPPVEVDVLYEKFDVQPVEDDGPGQ